MLVACGTAAPPPPAEPSPPPPDLPSLPQAAPVRAIVGGEDVSIELAFTGVGRLHRGFFSQEKPLAALGAALGSCVSGEVVVRVSWEDDIRLGHIALELPPEQLLCAPSPSASGLDLAPLEPVGRALAAYRDSIAAGYDFRVASFRGEVRLVRPGDDCLLRIGGQFPPDGTRWHRCVEVGASEICAEDPAGAGLARLEPAAEADRASLRACLGGS